MDDISTFVWLGIALLWFLVKLIRSGTRKAAREIEKRAAKADPATASGPRIEAPPASYGGTGAPPEPIEPR